MSKHLSILLLIAAWKPAQAQPPLPVCISFHASPAEVSDVIESANAAIPPNASLESACYTLSQRLTSAQTLSEVRHEVYELSWPTDEVIDRVRFHRRTRCARTGTGETTCSETQSAAQWNGGLVVRSRNMTGTELVEILRKVDDLIGREAIWTSVEKLKDTRGSRRFAGEREYALHAGPRRGSVYGRVLRAKCSDYADCEWSLSAERLLLIVD